MSKCVLARRKGENAIARRFKCEKPNGLAQIAKGDTKLDVRNRAVQAALDAEWRKLFGTACALTQRDVGEYVAPRRN